MPWTHIARENGNGLPGKGDTLFDSDGNVQRVVDHGVILTRQWAANYMYIECEPTGESWDDVEQGEEGELVTSDASLEEVTEDAESN